MSGKPNYAHLKALFINTTLKPSGQKSNTEGLMKICKYMMEQCGVKTEYLRSLDFAIAPGIGANLREKGFPNDAWPEIWPKVMEADILVLGTPIWLGEKSSECTKVIERLYSHSGERNEAGQYIFYGKVGGCLVTGNEDGIKHCGMSVLYGLQHVGYTIPPQADAGWIGEAGPGPSFLDEDGGGLDNDFTQRNTTFLTYNLMHLADMLKRNNGIPAYGTSSKAWREEGERFGHPGAKIPE